MSSELQRVVQAIQALPAEGDGMTVGDIAEAVDTDTGMVVAALEELAEQDQQTSRKPYTGQTRRPTDG
jgi:predicted ArsR family transcriptional regulator